MRACCCASIPRPGRRARSAATPTGLKALRPAPTADFTAAGGRRLVEFTPDGRVMPVDALLDGQYHNQPSDLVVDRAHRLYFTDPRHAVIPFGPAIFPFLDHASVLRLERNDRRAWVARRITYDTVSPRAVLLSPDEDTLYVADGDPAPPAVLHTFGADHRGPHRGIEGMCLDAEGNIVACGGWSRSGPGP